MQCFPCLGSFSLPCWPRPRPATECSATTSRPASFDIPPASFVVRTTSLSIKEVYTLGTEVGFGTYGTVRVGTHKRSGCASAVKCIPKRGPSGRVEPADFEDEVALLVGLDHPNLVKIFETYQDRQQYYMVMELCPGGSLVGVMERQLQQYRGRVHFNEEQATSVMRQIFGALAYMHDKNVCHLDLKPDNVLLAQAGRPIEQTLLKVADFGLATVFEPGCPLTKRSGTPNYVAPEVIEKAYDERADVWSCGIIMYWFLYGKKPFQGFDVYDTMRKVLEARLVFPKSPDASHKVKAFMETLIQKMPCSRPTARQALHELRAWTQAPEPAATQLNLGTVVQKMNQFHAEPTLKKISLHLAACRLPYDSILGLHTAFDHLDANGDGEVTKDELVAELDRCQISVSSDDVLRSADYDGSGSISFSEFVAAGLEDNVYQDRALLWQVFNVLDRNGDGAITEAEVQQVVESRATATQINAEDLASAVSSPGGKNICFSEFLAIMGCPNTE